MKLPKEGLNYFIKAAPILFAKFTFNILFFAFFSLFFLKGVKNNNILTLWLLPLFYILLTFLANKLLTKKILLRALNINHKKLFFTRKGFLSESFKEKFDYAIYQEDNLKIFKIAFIFFVLLNLISLPLYPLVKNTTIFYPLQIIILVFTFFFTSNIIVPLFLFKEYSIFKGEKNNEKDT